MDNILVSSLNQRVLNTSAPIAEKKPQSSFSSTLTDVIDQSASQAKQGNHGEATILVGSITPETSTVSELLLQNKKLAGSAWNIIYSDKNRGKDYTKIKPGAEVYFNQKTGALTWSGDGINTTPSKLDKNIVSASPLTDVEVKQLQPDSASKVELISLGKIDSNNPTVSHLLKNNEGLKQNMWELLGSDVNKDKQYHRIATETEIKLNPKTNEIVWNDKIANTTVAETKAAIATGLQGRGHITEDSSNVMATNLSEAVQGLKGISYDKINCYELLVKGLDNMNIAYSGKNGLYSKLRNMATQKGLAENAYLNGEGIVKAAGSTIVSKSYARITDWKGNAGALLEEIRPLLGSGQILSFSTENRGHTGIVGRKGDQWTFINSGRLDNSIDAGSIPKGVGEEVLSEEITNWFRSAQEKGEGLSVSLGQLDQGKIQTASITPHSFSGRI